jgi:signal transduction histidine kinase
VFRTELFRAAPFRLAVAFAAAIALVTLLLLAFIYWQMERFETNRIDRFLEREALALAGQAQPEIARSLGHERAGTFLRADYFALFSASGTGLAGNLARFPPGLPVDGQAHGLAAARLGVAPSGEPALRAVAIRLPDGAVLLLARTLQVLAELRAGVLHALEIGLLPALLLSLGAGMLLGRRALSRVKLTHRTIERIMGGDLHERLPVQGTEDDLDRLAASVNRMLDQLERLLLEVKGVGDNIAHDLRTPLARARAKLERGRNAADELQGLRQVVDTAVTDLDQAIGIITALLRIGEIETGRRRSGFGPVQLEAIAREVCELYHPVSEEHELTLALTVERSATVTGDGELLVEALANLVDNAVKFTPPGGQVRLVVGAEDDLPVIRVEDTGPGIPPADHAAVRRRFYRGEASRHTAGHGLGLSIVGAIVDLHHFRLEVRAAAQGTGAVFAIVAAPPLPAARWPDEAAAPARRAGRARDAGTGGPLLTGTAGSGS